jgi:hypothetical protein
MSPPTKRQIVANFLPPKSLQSFITPLTFQIYLLQIIFSSKFENEISDVAEFQEAVIDELWKVQKEEFSAAFQKLYERAKSYMYANGAYFEYKKLRVFLMCLRLQKISLKSFGPHCIL